MTRAPPYPYGAFHDNRRVTIREYRAYEEAVTRQQQARLGTDPPSYQTVMQTETQAPVDRFNNSASNNTSNSIDDIALRGDGSARSVNVTSLTQVAQPDDSQHTWDESYQQRDYDPLAHDGRVQASQERYRALMRAQGWDPCLQYARDQTAGQRQPGSGAQVRQSGVETEVSGHLSRLQLDDRRGHEGR